MNLLDFIPEPEPPAREKFAYVVPAAGGLGSRALFERQLTEAEADEKNAELEKLRCHGRYCKRENLEFSDFVKKEETKVRSYRINRT